MLIEDDLHLNTLIQENLQRYGYSVLQPDNLYYVMEEFSRLKPDLVLLDLNLPYYDGYYICRSIRNQSNVPIIIISARNQEIDQIMAIELGADDYLTKPFTFDLLQTKVKATIRRVYGEYASISESQNTSYRSLCINQSTLTLHYHGKEIELSKNEYKLVKKLIEHAESFVTREALIEEVWDSVSFVDDNTLTVNISRIKQCLIALGIEDGIKSKRGVGYMLYFHEEEDQ
jgi:DNA-binding response OmpR family regulator